jgi:hypothetical protein
MRRVLDGASTVLAYGHSIGDNIMLSIVARELYQRGDHRIAVMSPFPDLFEHNPHICRTLPLKWGTEHLVARAGARFIHCQYVTKTADPDLNEFPRSHIATEMCRVAGITGQVQLRPEVFLTADELEAVQPLSHQVCIQSSGQGSGFRSLNKEWSAARFQEVVDRASKTLRFVQVGAITDPPLVGALDLRGQTTLRQTAAVLAKSEAYIGQEGMLVHLARAVNCPAVVVLGGRILPEQCSYACNETIYSAVPCSPCHRHNGCERDRECLTRITSNDVLAALERLLGRGKTQLAIDRPWVSALSPPT